MAYFRHGDPLDDFDELDRKQARRLARLLRCSICGEPIQDDHYYEIEGMTVCPGCLDDHYRVEVDQYD